VLCVTSAVRVPRAALLAWGQVVHHCIGNGQPMSRILRELIAWTGTHHGGRPPPLQSVVPHVHCQWQQVPVRHPSSPIVAVTPAADSECTWTRTAPQRDCDSDRDGDPP
jgi:hypothetical protein